MDDGLVEEISKKEALRETGISYGQFYRWKRLGLIPEAWFRRRSTFTGQETFLPRQKLLERLRQIQDLKDRYSFEEMADLFSPDSPTRRYSEEDLLRAGLLTPRARALFPGDLDPAKLRFLDLMGLAVIEQLLQGGGLSESQVRVAAEMVVAGLPEEGEARRLFVVVCDGVSMVVVCTGQCQFDSHTRVAASVDLDRVAEDVRARLNEQAS